MIRRALRGAVFAVAYGFLLLLVLIVGNLIGYIISSKGAILTGAPICREAACLCRPGEAYACGRWYGISCAAFVECPRFKVPCPEPREPDFDPQLRR